MFSGGLSSYSIMLMVIAHLQSEGLPAAHAVALAAAEGADAQDADLLLAGLRAALRPTAAAGPVQGHADLGPLLCSFFDRFGKRFRWVFTAFCGGCCVSFIMGQRRGHSCP